MNTDAHAADLLIRAQDQADTGQGGPTDDEIAWVLTALEGDASSAPKTH